MRLKKSSFWSKIPNWVWVLISLAVAIAIWLFAAYTWPLVFATPKAVVDAFISKAASGVLWGHVWASLSRVLSREYTLPKLPLESTRGWSRAP